MHPAPPSVPWPLGGGSRAGSRDPGRSAVTVLPPQCWSSCSPSSRGCSASWTTSTSATPHWRRRWPWPPSCRACSLSQVRHQHSAQSPSGPSGAPRLLAGGSSQHSIQHFAWSGQCPHPRWPFSTTTLTVLFVLLHHQGITNPHTQCTCHTHL